MQMTLRMVVVILIALLVVVAIFGAASGIVSDIGDTVTGTGNEQSNTLDCVLGETQPDDVEECSPSSKSLEEPERYAA